MSRKLCGAMMSILFVGLWTACGGSGSSSSPGGTPGPAPTVAISATTGATQSAGARTPFQSALSAVVTQNGIPVSGEIVTFTAPTTSSGASGTFANGTATDVEITNTAGVATSSGFTANATPGSYTVMAAVSNATVTTSFSLTNVPVTFYAFYVSGQETASFSYYALAGSVAVDAAGNVWSGEQDYNDGLGGNGVGLASPEPQGDKITGGSLTFPAGAPPGQGTLTLNTNNLTLGPTANGVEVFSVQFVNSNHALITQFDGWDTSSGSIDLQTLPSTLNGQFAFAMSGFEPVPAPVDFGGVFSVSGSTISNGVLDINDADNTGITPGVTFTATLGTPDSYGRGTLSAVNAAASSPFSAIWPTGLTLEYYIIGPEAIRLIDVDLSDAAIGSAFGQGTATFSNASLGNSVFELSDTPYNTGNYYVAAGQFSTSNTSSPTADLSGYGDDDEATNQIISSRPFTATYSIGSNGYGSLNIASGPLNAELGDITNLGIYTTDPALNLEDPNNPAGGGGALAIDLSSGTLTYGFLMTGGMGVIVPQTDTTVTDFTGNYTAGWQNFDSNTCGNEFDMVSQGTMVAGGNLNLTGTVSDPFLCLSFQGTVDPTSSGDTLAETPHPDASHPGRYTKTKVSASIDGVPNLDFYMVMYQASAGQLFWLDYDNTLVTVAIGPIEQQGSLAGLPAAARQQQAARAVRPNAGHR